MKGLTKIAFSIAVLGAATLVLAQSPGISEKRKDDKPTRQSRLERVLEVQKDVLAQIKVTKSQSKEIDALNQKRIDKAKEKVKGLKEKGAVPSDTSREEAIAKLKKAHEEYNAELKAILGEKKFEQYQSLMKDRLKAMRNKTGRGEKKRIGR